MDKEKILSMDPMILLSMVNMKLRDFYSSLDSLCSDMGVEKEVIITKLSSVGFEYNEDQNAFR
ncbi:MAG: DUF4250 domain-containing protein [Clostridium sp.]